MQTLMLAIGQLRQSLVRDLLHLSLCSACKCLLKPKQPLLWNLFSLFASFTVDPWSDVWVATSAGVIPSLFLIYKPYKKDVIVRSAVVGSYIGTITWVLKKTFQIILGQDVGGSW